MENGEISEEKKNDWDIFLAKDWREQLTANLYAPGDNVYNAFYYLFSNKDLDTKDIAKEIYKKYYEKYKEMDESMMAGDTINSFAGLFSRYFGDYIGKTVNGCKSDETSKNDKNEQEFHKKIYEDIKITVFYAKGRKKTYEECNDIIETSKIANMYFHLITTIGNVMPWLKGFNPVTGGGLDIFQYKAPKFFALCKWMGQRYDDFVDNHYLQDFVNDDKTEALRFLNLDEIKKIKNEIKEKKEDIEKAGEKEKEELHKKIEELEKVWNLYFYRASKAIMKRSYRILKNEEIKDGKLSEKRENEFNKKFQEFCKECKVKQELVGLIKKLDKNDNTDNEGGKPEMLELDELIKKLDNLIEQL